MSKHDEDLLQARNGKLVERIEELEAALASIKQWCDAYPVAVFRPLSDEQIRTAKTVLSLADISIGALHAQWARHILAGVSEIIRPVLK
jgi:hypothetical protein